MKPVGEQNACLICAVDSSVISFASLLASAFYSRLQCFMQVRLQTMPGAKTKISLVGVWCRKLIAVQNKVDNGGVEQAYISLHTAREGHHGCQADWGRRHLAGSMLSACLPSQTTGPFPGVQDIHVTLTDHSTVCTQEQGKGEEGKQACIICSI